MQLSPGMQVDRYRVESLIDVGGSAHVYAVRHHILGTLHALKVLRVGLKDVRERLVREGQVQAAFDHPNLLPVTDAFYVGEYPALLMPLITGPTLQKVIRQRRISPAEAFALTRAIASGVAFAHDRGLVHRDLKPANVLLDCTGERVVPRVADFGLAKLLDQDEAADGGLTHGYVGTPAYSAPDQFEPGQRVGPAVDVWAIGVMLYEMLAGVRPFTGDSVAEVMQAVRRAQYQDVTHHARALGRAEAALVHRLMSADPGSRPAHARDVVAAIDELRVPGVEDALSTHGGFAAVARRFELVAPENTHTSTARATMVPPAEATLDISRRDDTGHIPRERTPFVGRGMLIAAVAERIAAGASLATLVGTGGVGKSRLALHYARVTAQAWPGGAWYCDVADAATSEQLAQVLARALDVALAAGDPVRAVGRALEGRGRCLVVLDNFDPVVDLGPDTLGRWLEDAPEAVFLTTCRERLRLTGEVLIPVDPLLVPPEDASPEEVEANEAVSLFVDRARAVQPSFQVTAENRRDLLRLVKVLDGLPLALEMAAARVRTHSLSTLAERLTQRLDLLKSDRRDISPRHATLRATVGWSWERLEQDAREALGQLTVFDGGFTLDAAGQVVQLADPDTEVDDVLAHLLDCSFLQESTPRRGAHRLKLVGAVRAFAAEQLADDARSAAEARHARFYAAFGAADAVEALAGAEAGTRNAAYAVELENLVLAARRASLRGDAATATAAAIAVFAVVRRTGPFTLGRRVLDQALALPGLDPADAVRARLAAARLALDSSDHPAATRHLEEAQRGLRDGDVDLETELVIHRGHMASAEGRLPDAVELWSEALALTWLSGDRRREGIVRSRLAVSLCMLPEREGEALEHAELALNLLRESEDRTALGSALGNLALIHHIKGRRLEAKPRYDQALGVLNEVGDQRNRQAMLANYGTLLVDLGDWKAAGERCAEGAALARRLGNQEIEAHHIDLAARMHLHHGRRAAARADFETALRLLEKGAPGRRLAHVLLGLAELELHDGRPERAERHASRALTCMQETKGLQGVPRCRLWLALALAHQGRTDDATAHLQAALAGLAARVNDPTESAEHDAVAGTAWFHLGRRDAAEALLASALAALLALDHPAPRLEARVAWLQRLLGQPRTVSGAPAPG